MDQEFSSESDIAPSDDKSWKPSSNSDETETISDSEEEADENNNNTKQNTTGLVISNTYSYVDLTEEDTMKTNSHYDDTKDLLKILNNETIEKPTNFKPDSELNPIEIEARSIINLCKRSDAKAKHCRIQTSLASNRLKGQITEIRNPLYHPSLKTYSKDLLQKNETSKKISMQEPEQDQIENQATDQLKVPNPLFRTSLMKEDSSKDLLEKIEATKMTSIQEPEQDQIGNPLKVPNPLYQPSLPKEDLSKDLLQKKETTKIISIQEPEQGNYGKEKDEPCKETPSLVENPEFAPTKLVENPEFRSSPSKKRRKIVKKAKRDFGPNQPQRQNGKPYVN